jgi:hypothetical protein
VNRKNRQTGGRARGKTSHSKNNLKTYLKFLKHFLLHFFLFPNFDLGSARELNRLNRRIDHCKDTTVVRVLIFLSLLTNVMRIIFAKFESQITYFLGFMNFFVKFRNFMTFFFIFCYITGGQSIRQTGNKFTHFVSELRSL